MLLHFVKMFTILARLNHSVRFRPHQQVLGYAKFKIKNKEERAAEIYEKKFNFMRSTITSALQRRTSLTVTDWKSIVTDLQKHPDYKNPRVLNDYVFDAVLSLKPPHDSLQNANTFIEAFGIQYDLYIKQKFIQLLAKKGSEVQLSIEEENELIELYVWNEHFSIG